MNYSESSCDSITIVQTIIKEYCKPQLLIQQADSIIHKTSIVPNHQPEEQNLDATINFSKNPVIIESQSSLKLSKPLKYIPCVQLESRIEKDNRLHKIFEKESVKVSIGREESNDIVINDKLISISKVHAQIYYDDKQEKWFVKDIGSTNGTYLRIHNYILQKNEEIGIGLHIFKVKEIIKDLGSFRMKLEVRQLVDNTLDPLIIEIKGNTNEKIMLGKSSDPRLECDKLMQDNECYFQFIDQKVHIFNCDNVKNRAAIKVQKGTPKMLKNQDLLRIGLINFYEFKAYAKLTEPMPEDSKLNLGPCVVCSQQSKEICLFNSCQHLGVCLKCSQNLSVRNHPCPMCEQPIVGFIKFG